MGWLGSKLSEAEVKQLMEAADMDGNGTIDYIEFIIATLHRHKLERDEHLYKAFQHFDKDNSGMESEECKLILASDGKIFKIFSDFMTRVTQFEELVVVGSRLLDGFRQGLEFLRQPPINNTSDLVNQIIRANETKRVLKYVEAGYKNAYDGIQNINKLHTSKLGLLDHLSKAKSLVNELEGLVREVTGIIETANKSRPTFEDEVIGEEPCPGPTAFYKGEAVPSGVQKPEITDYAVMMSIVYNMVKQDCIMQERIISSLSFKPSSGELETYSLMWSLRPFINDEIMHQAWKFIL